MSVLQEDLTAGEWEDYCRAGVERAAALGNRGLARFDDTGHLAQDIVDAYNEAGFYVFTDVLSEEEVGELRAEFDEILDNAPVARDAEVDHRGRPVRFPGYYSMSSADLFGRRSDGDDEAEGSPVVGLVSHPLMMMDSALRVYAHPTILRAVEAINGPDFVPFHESVWHKGAGQGQPTPWHQDGRTHWSEDGAALAGPDGAGESHGFNFNVSWSNGTPENCLWVLPGSHLESLLADGGGFPEMTAVLDDAVPMVLAPGDCGMVNRSSLHGSFRNFSPERRVTMVLGYHKRSSAIGASTTNVHAYRVPGRKNIHDVTYSTDYVERRSRMIALAIDARRQRFLDEQPYDYQGSFIGGAEWNDEARAEIGAEGDEYWRRDITL
jgi:ectoine hydroxylase-related dioxygenase (phytanoyl-CoA dioxygenase family)